MFEATYSARGEVVECLQDVWPLGKRTRDVGPDQRSNDEKKLHDESGFQNR
jgi:hypothetical protein